MQEALDLARKIEAGELTPATVIERCAQAITAREHEIGAFVTLDLEAARKIVAKPTLASQPLHGLPVGVKDIFDTADLATEFGSPIYAGYRPRSDAAVVSQIRRAGGVVLGKTVTTEFAYQHPNKTKNPHNLEHTPGGSSSGSAAAVAAGMVPIAIGSQTGGSVIRPAAYCGVAGFKPSFKLIPTIGMKCFSWHLDTVGLFAAGVADVAYAAAAITGRDLRVDRGTSGVPRIGLARTHVWPEASEAMRGAVDKAARAASSAGAKVEDVSLPPIFEDAYRAHATIQEYEAYRALAFEYDHFPDQLSKALRESLNAAAAVTPEAYDAARRTSKRARQALADLMTDIDALLTPAAPGAAPRGLGSTGSPTFNRLWTLMGTPCVNVAGLADGSNLPLGVQIVGRFGRDRNALEAALFLEKAIAKAGS